MTQKKQIKLATTINEIVIVNNKKLAPYIELVNFSSRNIDQKKLGTILGIFEIKDISEDSAYIVNFLSSVTKKTYFASHQKTPEESFESTLAKVNLSLSEIAKHGNVNWIGKVDAVLCSIFENQINFSVSGDAKVLLLRNNKLIEISQDLSPKDEAANPLKTFTDIASGRLELDDKLILTTDDISHIFSLEDLEKYATSFSPDKFLRFLKTALVNELDIAGTMVIDTHKATLLKEPKVKKVEKTIQADTNVFDSRIFEKAAKKTTSDSVQSALLDTTADEKEYTHQKTGHIYITDDSQENYQNFRDDKMDIFLENFKEKFSDFKYWLNENYTKKISYKIKRQFTLLFKRQPLAKKDNDRISIKAIQQTSLNLFEKIKNKTRAKSAQPQTPLSDSSHYQNSPVTTKITSAKMPLHIPKLPRDFKIKINKFGKKLYPLLKTIGCFISEKIKSALKIIKRVLPKFSKLIDLFLSLSPRVKIATLLILALIIILPLVLFLKKDASPTSTLAPIEQTAESQTPENINPSTQFYKEATNLYAGADLIGVFSFDNRAFAITKNKIIALDEKNKDYPFPDNFRNAQIYSFMNDLNLLFLLNDKNQLISFSPISLKFKEESINIASGVKTIGIGTYLTYLYLIDAENKQIYRYPRADNGFGEKIDWLQSTIDFDGINSVSLDGNLYLAKKDSVIKLFNRKTQEFKIKIDPNSSMANLFTSEDLTYIYVLDRANGELIKFDKDGNKKDFLSNQDLSQANHLWVDEKNNVAYFTTESALFKTSLPQ